MKKLVLICFGLFLSGFAVAAPSVATLQDKASFTLGVEPNQVAISNVQTAGIETKFVAAVGGKKIRCYVTHAVGNVSDAVCSVPGKGTVCNDLLRAAGKCQ